MRALISQPIQSPRILCLEARHTAQISSHIIYNVRLNILFACDIWMDHWKALNIAFCLDLKRHQSFRFILHWSLLTTHTIVWTHHFQPSTAILSRLSSVEMHLSNFPAEVLNLILSRISVSYMVFNLWKCGDRILNTRLSNGSCTWTSQAWISLPPLDDASRSIE